VTVVSEEPVPARNVLYFDTVHTMEKVQKICEFKVAYLRLFLEEV